jgi:hypothetical protein
LNLRATSAGIGGDMLPTNGAREFELTHWSAHKIPHWSEDDNAFFARDFASRA